MVKKICVIGADSVYGKGDIGEGSGGWVNRLRNHIKNEKKEVVLYNLGIVDDTTLEILGRIKDDLYPRDPGILIIAVEENDCKIWDFKGPKISLSDFEFNVYEIIKIAKIYSDKIVLIGLKKVDEEKRKGEVVKLKNQDIISYDNSLKEIAEENDCSYLELSRLIELEDLENGIDLNSNGHKKVAKAVHDILVKKRLL